MRLSTHLSILALLCFSACSWFHHDTTPAGIPPVTQEGRGTWGCYINGVLHTAYRNKEKDLYLEYYPPPDNGELHFVARFHPDQADTSAIESIQIGAIQNAKSGQYVLDDTSTIYLFIRFNNLSFNKGTISSKLGSTGLHDTLSHVIGTLNTTRLTATNIAGTFAFKAWRTGYIDTIHVTEGRFDY